MRNIVHRSQLVAQTFLGHAASDSESGLHRRYSCRQPSSVLLTAGCARRAAQTQPTFGELPPPALTPTSDRGNVAVVPAAGGAPSDIAPPPGAPAEDWALAETIRAELTKDKDLVHAPMEAVVDKGTVTLRGYAPNEHARQRLHERIASLPGVKRVDDQIEIKNAARWWRGVNRDFDKH